MNYVQTFVKIENLIVVLISINSLQRLYYFDRLLVPLFFIGESPSPPPPPHGRYVAYVLLGMPKNVIIKTLTIDTHNHKKMIEHFLMTMNMLIS